MNKQWTIFSPIWRTYTPTIPTITCIGILNQWKKNGWRSDTWVAQFKHKKQRYWGKYWKISFLVTISEKKFHFAVQHTYNQIWPCNMTVCVPVLWKVELYIMAWTKHCYSTVCYESQVDMIFHWGTYGEIYRTFKQNPVTNLPYWKLYHLFIEFLGNIPTFFREKHSLIPWWESFSHFSFSSTMGYLSFHLQRETFSHSLWGTPITRRYFTLLVLLKYDGSATRCPHGKPTQ